MQKRIKKLQKQLAKHEFSLRIRKNEGPYFPDYYATIVNNDSWTVVFGGDCTSFDEVEDWANTHNFT